MTAMNNYEAPEQEKESYHCPHCETLAKQEWDRIATAMGVSGVEQILEGNIGYCQGCEQYSLWVEGDMVYPAASSAPQPSDDMPEDVKDDFEEARRVVDDSPRAAAALLRLAMEKLAQELTGNDEQSLYQNIGDLIEEGRIDERIQQALDAVRVTGNDYVHAGEIHASDEEETAYRLFELVNAIVELTITRERVIKEAYADIPETKKQGIEQRDRK